MTEERVTLADTLLRVKGRWESSLPDFIQKLTPLPKKLFPDDQPLITLLQQDYGSRKSPIKEYLDGLNLTGEQSDYISRIVHRLAWPRVNGTFPNHEMTLKTARSLVRKGLLEVEDSFRDDAIMRETARRLLGLPSF